MLVAQSCLTLCDTMDCSTPGSLSMEFCRQEYWSGLPFPSSGDPPDPGVKPRSSALQTDSLPSEPPGKPCRRYCRRMSISTFSIQEIAHCVRPTISGSGRYPGKGNGYLLQSSCLENSLERGAWRAAVHGISKTQDTSERLTLSSICCCLKSEEINDLFPLFSFMIFFFQIIICFCMHPVCFYSLEGIFAVVYLKRTI